MITVELTAAIDASGAEQTFYFSDKPFQTGPEDTPAHTAFSPTLTEPADIGIFVFSDGRTGGGSAIEIGDTVIANDGSLDHLVEHGYDGRKVVVRVGEPNAPYPDGWTTVLESTARAVVAPYSSLIIQLQDKAAIFDRMIQTLRYAGNNTLPNGFEGTADDLKDRPKPIVFGKVFNILPPCINTSKLIYQPSALPLSGIPKVYVGGVEWTFTQDYPTRDALAAATMTAASATYATCLNAGMFRLSDSPDAQVTCDAVAGAAAANRTAGQILKVLALMAGAGSEQFIAGQEG